MIIKMEIPAFKKFVWWNDAEGQPQRTLIARIMTMGTWDEILEGLRIFGEEEFRSVLKNPPKGIFDRRSWNFWNVRLGISPRLPFPESKVSWPPRDELVSGHSS